jgi:uncharacterized protein (DUF2236 family)
MAGVDQHSDYREDPTGRLNRTARFVTTTTLGSTAAAERAIASVRKIHLRVHGTAPDGRPYRADDPALLTWVHTAEVACFLAGYQALAQSPLTAAECDRYFAEVARLAERLGAEEVPRSRAEVAAYLARLRPGLRATPAALEAVRLLRGFGRHRFEKAAVRMLTNASIGVLPGWAAEELGLQRPRLVRVLVDRPLARAGARLMVWACGDSKIRAAAQARATASPAVPAQMLGSGG